MKNKHLTALNLNNGKAMGIDRRLELITGFDHTNCSDFLAGMGYKVIDEINGDLVFEYK